MALITCQDCERPISDRAPVCPHCGAPAAVATGTADPAAASGRAAKAAPAMVATTEAAAPGGTVCPFSGHTVPAGATVCICGAYYGYSDPGAKSAAKIGYLLVGGCVLGAFVVPWPAKLVPVLFLLPGFAFILKAWLTMLPGKRWWRRH